jgi:hypothetical protein
LDKRELLEVEIAVATHARGEKEQTWLPAQIDDLFYEIEPSVDSYLIISVQRILRK